MKGRQEIVVLCLTVLMCVFIDTVSSDSKLSGAFKPTLSDCCTGNFDSCWLRSAYTGREECLHLLLTLGADVDFQETDGVSALMLASYSGHDQGVALLLNWYANVDLKSKDGVSALIMAAQNGHKECVILLLSWGANVNLQDNEGVSALFIASQNGHKGCAIVLLNWGANVNLQRKDGATALFMASTYGHKGCVGLLLNGGANIGLQGSEGATPLMMAAQNGHKGCLILLLNGGANVNFQRDDGASVLMMASKNGHKECVDLLLNWGANVNVQASDGTTPLFLASQDGYKECVYLLLNWGANVDLQRRDGASALFMAAKNGHKECAIALLNGGANPDLQTKDGLSPLFVSIKEGYTAIALLISGSQLHCCYFSLNQWIAGNGGEQVAQDCCLKLLHQNMASQALLSLSAMLAIYFGKRIISRGYSSKINADKADKGKKSRNKVSKPGPVDLPPGNNKQRVFFTSGGGSHVEVAPVISPEKDNDQEIITQLKEAMGLKSVAKQGLAAKQIAKFRKGLLSVIKTADQMGIETCPVLELKEENFLTFLFEKAAMNRKNLDENNEDEKKIKKFFKKYLAKVR